MTDVTPKIIQVTQAGLDDLQAELQELVDVKLPAAIERVAKAREYGDLAENSEYHNARDDQALLETRIAEIQNILQNAQVVKQTRSHSTIGIGSKVVVSVKGKKAKPMTLAIVGEFEANPGEGKVSSVSPLGTALMGKKKGDEVQVQAPAGVVTYLIENVT